MKTSTKLFIVLIACIPLSMVAYGYLLKQQFNAGKFVERVHSYIPKYTFKPLPAYKHVVVDGNLYFKRESDITRPKSQPQKQGNGTLSIQWNALVECKGAKNECGYKVLDGYEDIIKTKIINDTLYVSFYKLNGDKNTSDPRSILVSFRNSTFQTLKFIDGKYRLRKIEGDSLFLKTQNADVSISEIHFKNLNLMANKSESLSVDKNVIGSFQYSLQHGSKLNLETNKISSFKSLGVDDQSEISVQGKAKDMEQFLPSLSQNK